MGALKGNSKQELGIGTRNRNSGQELRTGTWNRNSEQKLGTETWNRNSERELRTRIWKRNWPHCVAQVLKDSAFAVVHNAFFSSLQKKSNRRRAALIGE